MLGTVMMLVGRNSREVALRVRDAMPSVKAALPKGMVLHEQYSRADLVDRTIGTVEHNLGIGALLVALVMPLAFLVTVSGMHAIGLSGNLMSLGRSTSG